MAILLTNNQFWESQEDELYLLGQYKMENVGDESIDFAPKNIVIETTEGKAIWSVLVDVNRLNVELEPGSVVNEWFVHTGMEGIEEVMVTIDTFDQVRATVEYDDSLGITFPSV